MKTHIIHSYTELQSALKEEKVSYLLIHKKDAEQSECALSRIQSLEGEDLKQILTVDVASVKDVHQVYGITSAPSLVQFVDGELKNVYKGCQTESFYSAALSGNGFTTLSEDPGMPSKRVIVYTTPSCSWCTTLKTYLNENSINYTEVDVASNPVSAEAMVRKSGQQGVPQTEINGNMIVGFDKNRINELLEIR